MQDADKQHKCIELISREIAKTRDKVKTDNLTGLLRETAGE